MRKVRYLTNIFIVGFWLTMMGVLAGRAYFSRTIQSLQIRFPEQLPYHKGWGVYRDGERIGQLSNHLGKNASGYLWENDVELTISVAQEEIDVAINGEAVFSQERKLDHFSAGIVFGGYRFKISGLVEGDALTLIVEKDNDKRRYTIPWRGDRDILGNGLLPWFYRSGLKEGDRFSWQVLNPLTQRKELAEALVQKSAIVYHKNRFVNLVIVVVKYQGLEIEFWVDEEGCPVKVKTPWGWELVEER